MALQSKAEAVSRIRVRDRLLWTVSDLAGMVNLAPTTVKKMAKDRVIPDAIIVRGRPFWRACEITDWISAGCPILDRWSWGPGESASLVRMLDERRAELDALTTEVHKLQQSLPALRREHAQLSSVVRDRKRLLHATGAAAV